jgi:hypothetical protein
MSFVLNNAKAIKDTSPTYGENFIWIEYNHRIRDIDERHRKSEEYKVNFTNF